jgi:hypothetical protein
MLVAVLQLLALFSLLYEGGILACAVKGTNSRRRNLELWAPHRLMTTLKRFANDSELLGMLSRLRMMTALRLTSCCARQGLEITP